MITGDSEERIVIVGGGAETLRSAYVSQYPLNCLYDDKCVYRKEEWMGRITMITADTNLPYDRPKLSLGMKHEAIMLRKPAWYEKVGG